MADGLDHPPDERHLAHGQEAPLDVLAQGVAQDAAEILVPRVGEEAPRVGQHPHEAAQEAQVGEGVDLRPHPADMVVEPPGGAVLHLAGRRAVVEIIGVGHHQGVVAGVEVVNDGARQMPLAVEAAEEAVHRGGDRLVGDGVEARVGAQGGEHALVVVSVGPDVVLLRPSAVGVHHGQVVEQGRLEFPRVQRGQRLAHAGVEEDAVDLLRRVRLRVERVQAVIREHAAMRLEKSVPLDERLQQPLVVEDRHVRGGLEPGHVGVESLGLVDGQRLVGPPRGEDAEGEAFVGDLDVEAEVVGGVVGRADGLHVHFPQQRLDPEVLLVEQGAAVVVNLPGRLDRQEFFHAKDPVQLQVRPVVEGVAHGVGQCLRPFQEFLVGRHLARDEGLVHAVGPHRPPLVVVAAQPDLGQVGELVVLGDEPRVQVAVIIDNRLLLGVFMIERAGRLALQKEVIIQKKRDFPCHIPIFFAKIRHFY